MNITEAITSILLNEPLYGILASKFSIVIDRTISKIRLEIYPQLILKYNDEWFTQLNNNHKKGVLIHEFIHLIFLHPYRIENRELPLWSVACDIAVNQYINNDFLFDNSITIDKIAVFFEKPLEFHRSAEYYYDFLIENWKNGEVRTKNGTASVETTSGELKGDLLVSQDYSESELNLFKYNLSASLNINGSIIENGLKEIYPEIFFNWKYILKKFLSHNWRVKKRKSFRRISRRYPGYPGNIRNEGINALLAIDESASMADKTLYKFVNDVIEINKITDLKIDVVNFDTTFSMPVSLNRYLKTYKRQKRGATDYTQVLKLGEKMRVDLIVIFTDGEGFLPDYQNQKVLWILTKKELTSKKFKEVTYYDP